MRYYIDDKKNNKRVYLRRINARTREELFKTLSSHEIKVLGQKYTINEIKAAPSIEIKTWRDLFANKVSKTEEEEAKRFNTSYFEIKGQVGNR